MNIHDQFSTHLELVLNADGMCTKKRNVDLDVGTQIPEHLEWAN